MRPTLRLVPASALAGATERRAQDERALHLFDRLQDKHLPVTLPLAFALADIEGATQPAEVPIWGRAFQLAGGLLEMERSMGRSRLWSRVGPVFLSQVAEPILEEAGRRLQEVIILASGPFGRVAPAATARDFHAYCDRLEGVVDDLLAERAAMGDAFWLAAGLSMLGSLEAIWSSGRSTAAPPNLRFGDSRRLSPARQRDIAVTIGPDIDRALSEIALLREPDLSTARSTRRLLARPVRRAARDRSGMRPKEGGVTGVVHSRRVEDLDDILVSELALPPQVLLQRVLEEGFSIRHRPPLRRPNRDLISLGLDESTSSHCAACIARSAWLDATLRLALGLAGSGQERSEFGWCHFPANGLRACATSAELFSKVATREPFTIEGPLRRRLLMRTGIASAFCDRRPEARLDGSWSVDNSEEIDASHAHAAQRAAAAGAILAACDRQRAAPGRSGALGGDKPARAPAAFSDYHTGVALSILDRHAPVGLSDTTREADGAVDWPAFNEALIKDLGLTALPRSAACLIVLPPKLEPGQAFQLYQGSSSEPALLEVGQDPDPVAEVARIYGALSIWIHDRTREALDDG